MANFCAPTVKNYELTASAKGDLELMKHLFELYSEMDKTQWADPMFRKWRRCVIVEVLKRGLISKDPGPGIPERG